MPLWTSFRQVASAAPLGLTQEALKRLGTSLDG